MLSVGDIVLSPSHREVTVAGEPLKLTLREFDLLEYLMRKPGVVFTRESLLQSVWGWDFDGGSRTVDVHRRRFAKTERACQRHRDRARRGLSPGRAFCR